MCIRDSPFAHRHQEEDFGAGARGELVRRDSADVDCRGAASHGLRLGQHKRGQARGSGEHGRRRQHVLFLLLLALPAHHAGQVVIFVRRPNFVCVGASGAARRHHATLDGRLHLQPKAGGPVWAHGTRGAVSLDRPAARQDSHRLPWCACVRATAADGEMGRRLRHPELSCVPRLEVQRGCLPDVSAQVPVHAPSDADAAVVDHSLVVLPRVHPARVRTPVHSLVRHV
eukprot:5431619-Prymnesium_polylepis.1